MSRKTPRHLDQIRALLVLELAITDAMRRKRLRRFLEGLVKPSERSALAQRLRIAWFLTAGHSYRGIRDATGAALQTISTVDRWLKRENPRYRRLFPIRHRRRLVHRKRLTDAERILPGSVKDLFRSMTGADLW